MFHPLSAGLALAGALLLSACAYTPPVSEEARQRAARVDCSQATCVDFIYIHGAATHSEDDRQLTLGRIDGIHEALSARLYDTPEFVEGALEGGKLAISPDPILYFWGGDISLTRDMEVIGAMLDSQEEREGRGPKKFYARNHRRLAEAIHNLHWVSTEGHRFRLTDSLHATVRESRGQGRRVVLLGYSAGAVVMTTYAIYRMPAVNLDEFSRIVRGTDVLRRLFEGRDEWTCGEALMESGLVEIDKTGLMRARLEGEIDEEDLGLAAFRDAYWASRLAGLPELTRRHCLDRQTLIGGVAYGSMANLLRSKSDDIAGELLVLMARELLRQGQFSLNVNHADDLVGFNVYEGVGDIARLEAALGLQPINGRGFDRSAEPHFKGANFINAHTWYIRKPDQFAALVADTYARGYQEMLQRTEPPAGEGN